MFPDPVEAAICVKKDDLFVSESIMDKGAWEEEIVHNLMKAVSQYEDAVFVGQIVLLGKSSKILCVSRCRLQPGHVHSDGCCYGQVSGCRGCHG